MTIFFKKKVRLLVYHTNRAQLIVFDIIGRLLLRQASLKVLALDPSRPFNDRDNMQKRMIEPCEYYVRFIKNTFCFGTNLLRVLVF